MPCKLGLKKLINYIPHAAHNPSGDVLHLIHCVNTDFHGILTCKIAFLNCKGITNNVHSFKFLWP